MVCTFGDATDVHVVARAEARRSARSSAATAASCRSTFGSDGWESRDPDAANARYAQIARQGRRRRAPGDRRDAARSGDDATGSGERAAPRRAEADRARRQVLREGRSAARVHLDPAVVRAPARQEGRAPREGRRDPLAPRLHAPALPQLDREPERRLVRQPPALLRRAVPGLVPARRERPARLRAPDRRRRRRRCRSIRRSTCRRATRAEQRDQPGGFTAEADVFDTWFTSSLTPQIGSGWLLDPDAPRDALSRRHPAAEPRDHPHLGVLHDRQGAAARATRSRGSTSSSRAGSSIPTARRCRRARATS